MPDFNFMNSPDFGAPGGIRANQEAQMNALAMQGTAALTRMHTAEAGLKEEQLRETGAFAKALSGAGAGLADGAPEAMSTKVAKWAMLAASNGAPMKALDLMKDSAVFLGHETAAVRNVTQQAHAELQKNIAEIDLGARLIGGISDQATQDAATRDWYKFGIKGPDGKPEPAPWEGKPYDPKFLNALKGRALSEKDKMLEEFRRDQLREKERADREREESLRILRDIQERDAKRREADSDRKAKSGGKVLSDVAKVDIDSILAMAEKDHEGIGVHTKEAEAFARSVAFDAKRMRQANPAIDPETARFRAYQARKSELAEEGGGMWGLVKGDVKYKSTRIGTREEPMALEPVASKRQVGKYYNIGGRIVQWAEEDGKKGWKVEED